MAKIELASGALATGGDYERFIEVDGRRYCHVLDPRNGWPAMLGRSSA
jgi:FAD:protein FMN transferase